MDLIIIIIILFIFFYFFWGGGGGGGSTQSKMPQHLGNVFPRLSFFLSLSYLFIYILLKIVKW